MKEVLDIVITIANVLFVFIIGITQVCLQKRYNKMQAYNIYGESYKLLKSIDNFTDVFILNIVQYFDENFHGKDYYTDSVWLNYEENAKKLYEKINDNSIDMEIKFSDIKLLKECLVEYQFLLTSIKFIISHIRSNGDDIRGMIKMSCIESDEYLKRGSDYLVEKINSTLNRDTNEEIISFNKKIQSFISLRNDIKNKNLCEKIKSKL